MKKSILIVLASILITLSCQIFAADDRKPHSFGSGDVLSADMLNEMFNATTLDLGETLIGTWSTQYYSRSYDDPSNLQPLTGTLTINSLTNASHTDFSGIFGTLQTFQGTGPTPEGVNPNSANDNPTWCSGSATCSEKHLREPLITRFQSISCRNQISINFCLVLR